MTELYAIVGNMERARVMLEAGVPWLQLRFKETPLEPHLPEVREWPARYPGTHLIVNDDLDLAVRAGAWGVHLGQEDLARYSPQALRAAPLSVGISTHSDAEIEIARAHGAAAIGFGPIFPTGTKQVGHPPQGVEELARVVRAVEMPVIAIGGISDKNLMDVRGTGVAMAAMISHLDHYPTPADLRGLMQALAG